MFTDDTQLYIGFNPKSKNDSKRVLDTLQNCFTDIQSWMDSNWLKLNPGKTEFMLVCQPGKNKTLTTTLKE